MLDLLSSKLAALVLVLHLYEQVIEQVYWNTWVCVSPIRSSESPDTYYYKPCIYSVKMPSFNPTSLCNKWTYSSQDRGLPERPIRLSRSRKNVHMIYWWMFVLRPIIPDRRSWIKMLRSRPWHLSFRIPRRNDSYPLLQPIGNGWMML